MRRVKSLSASCPELSRDKQICETHLSNEQSEKERIPQPLLRFESLTLVTWHRARRWPAFCIPMRVSLWWRACWRCIWLRRLHFVHLCKCLCSTAKGAGMQMGRVKRLMLGWFLFASSYGPWTVTSRRVDPASPLGLSRVRTTPPSMTTLLHI